MGKFLFFCVRIYQAKQNLERHFIIQRADGLQTVEPIEPSPSKSHQSQQYLMFFSTISKSKPPFLLALIIAMVSSCSTCFYSLFHNNPSEPLKIAVRLHHYSQPSNDFPLYLDKIPNPYSGFHTIHDAAPESHSDLIAQ